LYQVKNLKSWLDVSYVIWKNYLFKLDKTDSLKP
jgi:hypothetical protein